MTVAPTRTTVSLPIEGMDCTGCAAHIQGAVSSRPGVEDVQVLFSAERATVSYDPTRVSIDQIKAAIQEAGYRVREERTLETPPPSRREVGQIVGWASLGMVAMVVLVAAVGERIGFLDQLIEDLPWWVPALAILLGGRPVFQGVVQAARQRQITSHTLMTAGAVASILIGQWTTAALIVFFMRFADWLEARTAERNRRALQQLIALQPAVARVERDGRAVELPVEHVRIGEVVLVRPGERIPIDGEVIAGQAPVDQAPITGESMPVDKAPGDAVFAATVVQAGFLKVQATGIGEDTTFGRIVRLVEEAEAHKAPVQRFADRFSTYYLPLVLLIAALTYLVTGQVANAVAVVVVSCACAIALATPVVVLASVGAGAQRGILIKGGLTLEQLARVDTIVMDKTGTLTHGQPQVTDVVALNGVGEVALLGAVAAVESRSEHLLARAIVRAAQERGLAPSEPEVFSPLPGRGLVGTVQDASGRSATAACWRSAASPSRPMWRCVRERSKPRARRPSSPPTAPGSSGWWRWQM